MSRYSFSDPERRNSSVSTAPDDIEAVAWESSSRTSSYGHSHSRKAASDMSVEVISIEGSQQDDSYNEKHVDHEEPSSRLFRYNYLDRALERKHITGIAFSGTIGIGLFISSGKIIAISGSLGCVLGFICAGFIVIAVMRSLAEMVSVRPVFSALIDYPHTFVDPALGFAVGITYCLAQCFSMATLTSAAAAIANNFQPSTPLHKSQTAGIIIGLYFITVLSNACGVRIYGNLERVFKWIKMLIILVLCLLMIVINVGNYGYPTTSRAANYTTNGLTPGYKPDGFNSTHETRDLTAETGIPGGGGQLLSVLTAMTLAVFACMGGDIVIVSAGEAKTPRKDLPAVARFMYLAPLACYVLGSFLVGLNINYADPNLSRVWAQPPNSTDPFTPHSPFIIALSHSSIAPSVLPNLFSALFLFSAYSAANTGLFAASRTLFAIARLYGNKFLKRTVGRTNQGHTPLTAIVICSLFVFLAFLGLADDTFDQPILSLSSFFTGTVSCVYGAECVAYLRFKKGLDRRGKVPLLCRDDEEYKRKHYRAHWQPFWAIFGLIGCIFIMLFTGWVPMYILSERHKLKEDQNLKPNRLLAWDLVGAYSGPILFFALYLGYKFWFKTQITTYREFDAKYFKAEFDENADDFPDRTRKNDWRFYLRETWSYIK